MYYWLLMELAEKMLATLLGRVIGPGLHLLLKPFEDGLKGGHLCRYLIPLTATRLFPLVFGCAWSLPPIAVTASWQYVSPPIC